MTRVARLRFLSSPGTTNHSGGGTVGAARYSIMEFVGTIERSKREM